MSENIFGHFRNFRTFSAFSTTHANAILNEKSLNQTQDLDLVGLGIPFRFETRKKINLQRAHMEDGDLITDRESPGNYIVCFKMFPSSSQASSLSTTVIVKNNFRVLKTYFYSRQKNSIHINDFYTNIILH